MKLLNLLLICAGALSSTAASAQTQTLFWDDFEAQDVSAWSGASTTTPNIVNGGAGSVVSTYSHSGAYSYRATLPANGGEAKLLESLPSSQNTVYLRFFLYVDGSSWSQVNPVVLSTIGGGEQILLRNSSGVLYLSDGNGIQGTHPITESAWHSIEIESAVGSGSNGVANVWLDGALDITSTSETWTTPFTTVYLGPDNAGTTDPSGSLYFDDVVVSTAPIGDPAASITVRYPNSAVRSALPVDVVLFGQASTDTLAASVDGTSVYTQTGSITGHQRFSFPLNNLSVGNHNFVVQLSDSSGNIKATFTGTLQKFVSGLPTNFIDDDNDLNLKGSKYFPVTPFIDGQTEFANVWLANGAVNTYGWVACYTPSFAYTPGQFDTCMNSIGYPVIGPDNNWTGVTGSSPSQLPANQPNAASIVANYVTSDAGNPNLFMWTWQDEPNVGAGSGQVSPSTMLTLEETTHNNDGNHPVITNLGGYPFSFIAGRQNGWTYPIIPNNSSTPMVSDVYGSDMYPFIYSYDGWTVTQMVAAFDWFHNYTFNLVPLMPFIEGGVCATGLPCAGYGPTAPQAYMEAWLAVIHGAKGIGWWGPAGWTVQDSAHWAALSKFKMLVSSFQDVILTSTSRTVTSNETVQHSRVDVMVREDGNSVYVFAARLSDVGESSDPSITATLTLPGFNYSGPASVATESRTVSVTSGVLTDVFAPSDVHIYCIPKAAGGPLPPCPVMSSVQ